MLTVQRLWCWFVLLSTTSQVQPTANKRLSVTLSSFPHLFFNESPEPLTHIHLFDIELKYLQCTANTSSSINILSTWWSLFFSFHSSHPFCVLLLPPCFLPWLFLISSSYLYFYSQPLLRCTTAPSFLLSVSTNSLPVTYKLHQCFISSVSIIYTSNVCFAKTIGAKVHPCLPRN